MAYGTVHQSTLSIILDLAVGSNWVRACMVSCVSPSRRSGIKGREECGSATAKAGAGRRDRTFIGSQRNEGRLLWLGCGLPGRRALSNWSGLLVWHTAHPTSMEVRHKPHRCGS